MSDIALWRFVRWFFFQAEDGIRDDLVTGVQTCALPICNEELKKLNKKLLEIYLKKKGGK
mgnify:CR=1 FL=1